MSSVVYCCSLPRSFFALNRKLKTVAKVSSIFLQDKKLAGSMIGSGTFEAVGAVGATTAGFKDTGWLLIGNPDFKSGNNFLLPLNGFVLFAGTPKLPSQLLRHQLLGLILHSFHSIEDLLVFW